MWCREGFKFFKSLQIAAVICVACLASFLAGCTSTPMVLLKPAGSTQPLKVTFPRAYFAPSESGEDQIVLVSDPIDDPTDTSGGEALSVTTAPPLWQVVLIQLHWRTSASPKIDSLVANNAVLHWYVYGKPTSTGIGVLDYSGTGSVSIDVDSSGANVTINHADLTLADRHGEIHDPFHQFQINGMLRTQTNPAQAHQYLEDVASNLKQADQHEPPPATRP